MIYYLLQISTTKPVQFRISVLADPLHNPRLLEVVADEGFQQIGMYAKYESLLLDLEPHLRMEDSA